MAIASGLTHTQTSTHTPAAHTAATHTDDNSNRNLIFQQLNYLALEIKQTTCSCSQPPLCFFPRCTETSAKWENAKLSKPHKQRRQQQRQQRQHAVGKPQNFNCLTVPFPLFASCHFPLQPLADQMLLNSTGSTKCKYKFSAQDLCIF